MSEQSAHRSIADFYSADERRRASEETVFGDGWTRHDDASATYRLSFVHDTGELYLVREPHPGGGILAPVYDQFGVDQAPVDDLTVEVLTTVEPGATADAEALLEGWEHGMTGPDSLAWLYARLGR